MADITLRKKRKLDDDTELAERSQSITVEQNDNHVNKSSTDHFNPISLSEQDVKVLLEEPANQPVKLAICGRDTVYEPGPRTLGQDLRTLAGQDSNSQVGPALSDLLHERIRESVLSQEPFVSMPDKQKCLLKLLLTSHCTYYDTSCTVNSIAKARSVYTVHVMNHLIKSRTTVYANNAELRKLAEMDTTNGVDDTPEYRDQGITRPKVLILAPFRDSAYKIVRLINILFAGNKKGLVANRKRFVDVYGPIAGAKKRKEALMKKNKKPFQRAAEYDKIFRGNTDDCFRFGIQVGRKRMKIFSDFYSSDLIVASPLGLRMAMGGEAEKNWDIDFLSCLEMVILDQADIFMMQNIEHLMFIYEHMHQRPSKSHGVDFSRVKNIFLSPDFSAPKLVCQHLVFSAVPIPELRSLLLQNSKNISGRVEVCYRPKMVHASLIDFPLPQTFHNFRATSVATEPEERFKHFFDHIFPTMSDSQAMQGTLIFVPSYFDFVRVRNQMKLLDVSFVQICEYTKNKKIARARDMFFHERKRFCVYTERFHFYRRYIVKGIKHIVFYQLPQYPQFYSELCNLIVRDENNRLPTCTVLFSKYDSFRLSGVLGHERAVGMLQSEKTVHVVMTE